MKRKKIIIIITVIFLILILKILSTMYMRNKIYNAYNNSYTYIKDQVLSSDIIKSKIGDIKEVDFSKRNIFVKHKLEKKHEIYIPLEIVSKDNQKYTIFAITPGHYKIYVYCIGYVINDEFYYEYPQFDVKDYEAQMEEYKIENTYLHFENYNQLIDNLSDFIDELYDNSLRNRNKFYNLYYDYENHCWLSKINIDTEEYEEYVYILIADDGEIKALWKESN